MCVFDPRGVMLGSCRRRRMADGRAAAGKLMKKHHRQDRFDVSTPPRMGATAMAVYSLALIRPTKVGRLRNGVEIAMMLDGLVGNVTMVVADLHHASLTDPRKAQTRDGPSDDEDHGARCQSRQEDSTLEQDEVDEKDPFDGEVVVKLALREL